MEAHLALSGKRRLSLGARGGLLAREAVALEKDLEEDLGVEGEGRGVERYGGAVDSERVRASDGMRDEQVDEVLRGETSIGHAVEDLVERVLGLGDRAILGRELGIGAAGQELEAGRSRAASDGDGSSELDKISGRHGELAAELLKERLEQVHGVVNAVVRVEEDLGVVEEDHRTVSAGAPESRTVNDAISRKIDLYILEFARLREADGIVEGQTENLVRCRARSENRARNKCSL